MSLKSAGGDYEWCESAFTYKRSKLLGIAFGLLKMNSKLTTRPKMNFFKKKYK